MKLGSIKKMRKRYWLTVLILVGVVVWGVGRGDPAELLVERYGARISTEGAFFNLGGYYFSWWPQQVVSVDFDRELDDQAMGLLLRCRQLRRLGLSKTPKMDSFASQLKRFRELEYVRIGGRVHLGQDDFAALTEMSEWVSFHVKSLYVESLTGVPEGGWELLGGIYTLKNLHLEGAAVDDLCLVAVGKASMLQVLDLKNVTVTDEGLGALIGLKDLWSIGLTNVAVTDGALDYIEQMKRVGLLKLEGTGITEAGVARLKESRPDIVVRVIEGAVGDLK